MASPQLAAPVGTKLQHRSAKLPDDLRPSGHSRTDSSCVIEIPALEELLRCTSDAGAMVHAQSPPRRHRATAPAPGTASVLTSSSASLLCQQRDKSLVGMPLVKQLQHASLDTSGSTSALGSGSGASRTSSDASTHEALGVNSDSANGAGASLAARSTAGTASLGGSMPGAGARKHAAQRLGAWSLAGLLGSRRSTRDAGAVRVMHCLRPRCTVLPSRRVHMLCSKVGTCVGYIVTTVATCFMAVHSVADLPQPSIALADALKQLVKTHLLQSDPCMHNAGTDQHSTEHIKHLWHAALLPPQQCALIPAGPQQR